MRFAALIGATLIAGCGEVTAKCCDAAAIRVVDVCVGDATSCSILELEGNLRLMRLVRDAHTSPSAEHTCFVARAALVEGEPAATEASVESEPAAMTAEDLEYCAEPAALEEVERLIAAGEAELLRLRSLQDAQRASGKRN